MYRTILKLGARPAVTLCRIFLMACLILSYAARADQQTVKKEFPRLGGMQIGKSPMGGYGSSEYQKEMSRLDVVILGGTYSINEAAEKIKLLNPRIKLGKYTNMWNIADYFTTDSYWKPQIDKAYSEQGPNSTNAFDWWARDLDGNRMSMWTGRHSVNFTEFVRPDVSGERWPEWRTKYDYQWWFHNDVWDFWYSDEVSWYIRRPHEGGYADWNGKGGVFGSEMNAALRRGHQAHWNAIRQIRPDIKIMANSTNWPWHEDDLGRRDIPEYDQQIEGGVLERIMRSYKFRSWGTVMAYYRRNLSYLIEPKVVMFIVQGPADDYQFFRYTFATCLMNDGYFDYTPMEFHFGTVEWFDEFDLAGQSDTSWLGLATTSPPTQAWQNGVYRRDFQNGIALVNPEGNGRQTVTVEDGFMTIAGKQDPGTNSGTSVWQITLEDSDGIVLVRQSFMDGLDPTTPSPPKAPTLTLTN